MLTKPYFKTSWDIGRIFDVQCKLVSQSTARLKPFPILAIVLVGI